MNHDAIAREIIGRWAAENQWAKPESRAVVLLTIAKVAEVMAGEEIGRALYELTGKVIPTAATAADEPAKPIGFV